MASDMNFRRGVAPDTLRRVAALAAAAVSMVAVFALGAGPVLAAEGGVKLQFDRCTPTQQNEVAEAVQAAAVAVEATVSTLSPAKPSFPAALAVDRWFGEATSHAEVAERLQAIADRLESGARPILVECDLSEPLFAWTYRGMEGDGYLGFGQAFFAADLDDGFDSRMGTVVHELAHMVPEVAAHDHAYDVDKMRALARNAPDAALMNAQSYEYLVEDLFGR
jgi:peptidyl-Lys metalloendopeptidase